MKCDLSQVQFEFLQYLQQMYESTFFLSAAMTYKSVHQHIQMYVQAACFVQTCEGYQKSLELV